MRKFKKERQNEFEIIVFTIKAQAYNPKIFKIPRVYLKKKPGPSIKALNKLADKSRQKISNPWGID